MDGLPQAWRDLPRVPERGAIARAAFERDVLPANAPFVLRGQVADWAVVTAGRDSPEVLAAHLVARANATPLQIWSAPAASAGRFRYDETLTAVNFERRMATVAQLCTLLLRCVAEADSPSLFAGAVNLDAHLPALLPELPMPLLHPEQERLTSLWIGTRSSTAAHWDRPANLACPIAGPRHFLLFPPQAIGDLYIGPIDFTLAGQPMSLIDAEAPDFARFPRYADALTVAQVASLEPGDTLYLPPLWFHHVLSPAELGAQINFWWLGDSSRISPLNTLLHAMLTLKDLPASERASWRALFNHYIFAAEPETVSHIPLDARGILGPRDSVIEARLMQKLAEQLRTRI
jgi:hypothetical protein